MTLLDGRHRAITSQELLRILPLVGPGTNVGTQGSTLEDSELRLRWKF